MLAWLREPKALLNVSSTVDLRADQQPEAQPTISQSNKLSQWPANGETCRVALALIISEALNRVLAGAARNDCGLWLAQQLCWNNASLAEQRNAMIDYQQQASAIRPTNTKGEPEPYTPTEALRTLESAQQQPKRGPWGANPTSDTEIERQIEGLGRSERSQQMDRADDGSATAMARLNSSEPFRSLPIERIDKLGAACGAFDIHFRNDQVARLGAAAAVLEARKVQAAIADATTVVIPDYTRSQWRPIAQLIFQAAETDDIGIDPETEARGWLAALTGNWPNSPRYKVDLQDAGALYAAICHCLQRREISLSDRYNHFAHSLADGYFITTDRTIVLRVDSVLRWVTVVHGARTTSSDLRLRLHRLGFRKRKLQARRPADDASAASPSRRRHGPDIATARVLISPPGFDPDEGL
jgi:hypothetical protein